jgi:hypothetical protein
VSTCAAHLAGSLYPNPLSPDVRIVTQCCTGVTNKPLFFGCKNSGSKLVKNVIHRYNINLEALKSYEISKAMKLLML